MKTPNLKHLGLELIPIAKPQRLKPDPSDTQRAVRHLLTVRMPSVERRVKALGILLLGVFAVQLVGFAHTSLKDARREGLWQRCIRDDAQACAEIQRLSDIELR